MIQNKFAHEAVISEKRKAQLQDFCRKNELNFNDFALLNLAFVHRSCSNDIVGHQNNERLEFLGDSILGMVTASYLYETILSNAEGDLAKIKSVVVSEQTLAPIALSMGIDKCLLLGHGEELTGGRQKKAILADATEAVIGAYFLDSGYEAVKEFVLRLMVPEIHKVQEDKGTKDYKTLLQELYQKEYKTCPIYELTRTEGPDHDRTFWIRVKLGKDIYGPKPGKTKKAAEQNVAQFVLQQIKI